ncbi:MAG: sulfatase [Phycisphaerae bacterium]|jgi:arylsulfatase A-like enzyme|nr:sulfatase [Phycisphaerae bacterium]
MKRRDFLKAAGCWAVAFGVTGRSRAAKRTDRPNIIYILADDLGYGDLGCYGGKLNATPNIDRMAGGGVRFTDFHAASWCAPSRISLMTGCHPNRPGLMGRNSARLSDRITIAEMLREQGYATALIGKWHLGMGKGTHPLDQGFDYWFGTRGSNDWDGPRPNYGSFKNAPESAWKTPLYVNRQRKGVIRQSLFTQRYTKEVVRLIRENKDKPQFIYLAHNMPHVPIFASEKFRGKSANGVYGDVIAELDWSVGEIIRAVKDAGLSDKTLIVFTSDNGPWTMFKEFGGLAGPLRGEKSTTWEGGQRVPCVFYWPGAIKPMVNSEFMVNCDVYATLAGLTGSTVKKGQAIDSNDMSGVLLSGDKSPRTRHIFYHHKAMAYRSGDYKVHFSTRRRTRDPETGKGEPSKPHNPPLLFNVKKDIAESRNIAADHPRIVERLTKEFKQAQAAIRNWEKLPG